MREKNIYSNFADTIIHKIEAQVSLSMSEKYWVMHINFEHFFKHIKSFDSSANSDKLRSKIYSLKKNIISEYSNIFEQDFSNFTLNLIDTMYEKQSWINELSILKENGSKSNVVHKLIILSEKIKSLSPHIDDIASILNNIKLETPVKLDKLSHIKKLRDFLKVPRNLTSINKQTDSIRSLKKKINLSTEIINECEILMTEIFFDTNDDEFQLLKITCREKGLNEIENYLIILEYALNQNFNDEAILLFLFVNLDNFDVTNTLKTIIKKRAQLLLKIYNTVISSSTNVISIVNILLDNNLNDIPSEITEPYVSVPPFYSRNDDGIYILLKLKKLIALFLFYCKATNVTLLDPLRFHLRDLEFILKETKLTEIAYNPLLDDLPSYVLETFGLNNNDLAEILNKDKSTISRQRADNTILRKHLWFWKTATGFTYTYINGNTTIPNYGKDSIDDTKYRLYPVTAMAFAELFLKRISQLKEYQESLKNKQAPLRKKYILSKKYLKQISMKSIILSEKIREHRIALDKLYEQFVTASTVGFDESEKTQPSSWRNFENHFEQLIKKLDEAIKILDQN